MRYRFLAFACSGILLAGAASLPAFATDDDDEDTIPVAPAQPAMQPGPAAAAPQPEAPPSAAPAQAAPAAPAPDKAAQLSGGVERLNGSFAQRIQTIASLHTDRNSRAAEYYRLTGDISQRLAVGAPEADPALEAELTRARQWLAALKDNTAQLNAAASALTDDAASALYLSQQVRGELDVPGRPAAERATLAGVEAKISDVQARIDQKLRELLAETARQNRSLAVEDQNLELLAREIRVGGLVSAARTDAGGGDSVVSAGPSAGRRVDVDGRSARGLRPLVVVPRDAAGQSYEHELYAAVSETLQRSPNASFTVRAVTPDRTSSARWALEASDAQRKADDVVRSLTTFGLSRSRIARTEGTDDSVTEPEVQVFAGRP